MSINAKEVVRKLSPKDGDFILISDAELFYLIKKSVRVNVRCSIIKVDDVDKVKVLPADVLSKVCGEVIRGIRANHPVIGRMPGLTEAIAEQFQRLEG